MTIPGSDPLSFATIAWRLAAREGCQACGRSPGLRSSDCAACNAILDQLVAEEQLQRTAYLSAQVTSWQAAGLLGESDAIRLQEAIVDSQRPRTSQTELATAAITKSGAAPEVVPAALAQPTPKAEAPVRRRRVGLRQLGESLLAERTLNTLLGLGAFLILASALVISVFNPTGLALLPHLSVLGATTLLFYAAGWLCYTRMRLVRAGEALLGIGAGFVPLDVWSMGRADAFAWQSLDVWTIASAVAFPIYLGSYMLLPRPIFAWLVAVAGGSLLVAGLARSNLPPEWVLCGVMLLSLGYTLLSARLSKDVWKNMGRALFGLAHLATPPVLFVLLVAKVTSDPEGSIDSQISEYAVGAAWWLGVSVYALSAYQRRRAPFKGCAAWLIPVAYLLTLTKTPWDAAWYGVCLAGLGTLYAEYALRFERPRRSSPVVHVGLVLTLAAIVWPLASGLTWALVASLAGNGLLYLSLGVRARSRLAAFASVGVLAAAWLLALHLVQWAGLTPAQPWPWLVLVIALGGGGEVLVRRSQEQDRPLRDIVMARGAWKAVFAPALFDAAYVSSFSAVAVALDRSSSEALTSGVVLALVALGAAVSAWSRHSGLFVYLASILLPLALLLGVSAWDGSEKMLGIGLSLAVLGSAYAWVGRRFDAGRRASYRQPMWLIGLWLSVVGPAIAVWSGDASRQSTVAGVCALLFAVTLTVVRRPVWVYPVTLWTLTSYELTLRALLPNPRPEYVLSALVVPTCLALGLAELVAGRLRAPTSRWSALAPLTNSEWGFPLLVTAVVGFVLSLAGSTLDPGIGASVPAIYGVVLAAVAIRHGDKPSERWASLVLFALAGLQVLAFARVSPLQQPPFWSAFGLVLALVGLLARRWLRPSIRAWSTPCLGSGAFIAGVSEMAALAVALAQPLHTLSLTTGAAGVVLLILAYAHQLRLLAYAGVALVLGAGLLEVANGRIGQPQAYALPVGVYLAGLAWLEWRRGDPVRLKAPLELAALLVVLGTTLVQALGALGDGLGRYPYDIGLIGEGLTVLGLGAITHWWRSLFSGTGAIVAAVLILLAEPLSTLNTWYLLGSAGVLMIGVVVMLERRRRQIATWLDTWRVRMESWT